MMDILQNLKKKSPNIDIKKLNFIEGLDLENIHTKLRMSGKLPFPYISQ